MKLAIITIKLFKKVTEENNNNTLFLCVKLPMVCLKIGMDKC